MPYLKEFLRQVKGTQSGNQSTLVNRCKQWIEAPAERRKYIFKSKPELRTIYTAKHGKQPKVSWTAKTLTDKIVEEPSSHEANSFEQDVMNAIVGNGVLTRLSIQATESCAKGHEMEPIYSTELMKRAKDGNFPYGILEEIDSVGTVQKRGANKYIKTSVDGLLGIASGEIDDDRTRELLPIEFKARVKAATEQAEHNRIEQLLRKDLMRDDSIYVNDMDDNDQHSHLGIESPDERIQALHHAFVFGKNSCIHAVGNTKNLLTVCKMNFSAELISAYKRTLTLIYDSGLDIFYREDGEDDISASDEEMARIEKAVEVHKKAYVNMQCFRFNYCLWRDLTQDRKLPMPPLLNLLPDALSWWNINKPTGDTITEMIWDLMYYTPVSNPQAVLVKRLAHQLPTYMCHRLFQLFSTSRNPSSFSSIYQYRDATRRDQSFFNSTNQVGSILRSLAERYNPERPLAPAAQQQSALAVAGTYTMHGSFPPTGQSPLKTRRAHYEDPSNSNELVFQRRHNCVGCNVYMVVDEHGNPINPKICSHCGKDNATFWCTQCRCFLHGNPPRGETPVLMAAAAHLPPNNRKRTADGDYKPFYTRMSCSDQWHYHARQRAFSNIKNNSMVCVTVTDFDPSQHNVNSNLSFDDATINTSEDEDNNTHDNNTADSNNSNDDSSS